MDEFVRKGHEGVTFFVGPEIEQTPAFNKKTLFVVGLQDTQVVLDQAKKHGVKHIFLSANRSFDSVDMVNGAYMVGNTLASDWDRQIQILLSMGFMVSIDYPAHKHAMVLNILNPVVWQSRNFVPILSVAIPYVSTSNINLTIKIDDINFGATNPGVWCMNHHEVTDSNRFTAWSEYTNDVITAEQPKQVVNKPLSDVKNQTELGLDPDAKSQLKPEDEETAIQTIQKATVTSVTEALEAYTAGTTADPLSTKASKTTKGKK
jgi:hypothetical protein